MAAPAAPLPRDVIDVADIVAALAVIAVAIAALIVWRRRAATGSACCREHEATLRRVRPHDRNKAHYPYETTLSIGGMTCERCAIRVETALNALPDTLAQASIADRCARVRTKQEPDVRALHDAVEEAGYVVL